MEPQTTSPNKSKIIGGVLVVLGLLVLGIMGYAYYRTMQGTTKGNTSVDPFTPTRDLNNKTEQPQGNVDEVKVFFVDVENKRGVAETIGCGDSMIAVTRDIPSKNLTMEELIKAALTYLFEVKTAEVGKGGMYNALYQADLTVTKIELKDSNATVYVEGALLLGGTCDDPRALEQVTRTILQFAGVKDYKMIMNNNTEIFRHD
jgi:hypothetical protein